MAVTFDQIVPGQEFTRPDLAKLWGYKSFEAISRGIVTPAGTSFIIMFITKEKQSFLPQYADVFDGGSLEIEGETNHSADDRIMKAESVGDEIHLFYREKHHTPFTYFGKLYLTNAKLNTNKPSRFRFVLNQTAKIAVSSLETEEITHGITEFVPDEEGKRVIRQHITYERSQKNRKKALEIHGNKCKACGFDFNKYYDPLIAKGYIEIHHVNSVSLQHSKPVNPEIDLIPLCSNCHSMAHRQRGRILSLEELKAIIVRKRIEGHSL